LREPAERTDDVLGQSVSEVVVGRSRTQGQERQHGDGGPLRQWSNRFWSAALGRLRRLDYTMSALLPPPDRPNPDGQKREHSAEDPHAGPLALESYQSGKCCCFWRAQEHAEGTDWSLDVLEPLFARVLEIRVHLVSYFLIRGIGSADASEICTSRQPCR